MLVLTRKIGETIFVGNVKIVVADIAGARVRIGIDAPDCVHIVRGEMADEPPLAAETRYCVQTSDRDRNWPPLSSGVWLRSKVAALKILRRLQWLQVPGPHRVINQRGEVVQ